MPLIETFPGVRVRQTGFVLPDCARKQSAGPATDQVVDVGVDEFPGARIFESVLLRPVTASLERPDRVQFDLMIASKESLKIRPQIEHTFRARGVEYELWASSPNELRYEVSVPVNQDIEQLAKIIEQLDGRDAAVEWAIKKYTMVRT